MSKKRVIPKELLTDLYDKKKLTIKEIARSLHTSYRAIRRNLKEQGIHIRTNSEIHLKHGMFRSRPYHIWLGMKTRCDNFHQSTYQKYGALGISYPQKWSTFKGFWEDMKNGYAANLTLDRKDGSKSYSQENCRWINYAGQNRNKSDNVLVTYNGETKTIAAWAEEVDILQATLYSRKRRGWSDERIVGEKHLGKNQYSKR